MTTGFNCLTAAQPIETKDIMWFVADYRKHRAPPVTREKAKDFLRREFRDREKVYWRYARDGEESITP
jgi:hypothetical protein